MREGETGDFEVRGTDPILNFLERADGGLSLTKIYGKQNRFFL